MCRWSIGGEAVARRWDHHDQRWTRQLGPEGASHRPRQVGSETSRIIQTSLMTWNLKDQFTPIRNIWCPASSNAFQPWTYSCLGFYLSEFRDIPLWDFCLLPRQTVELIFGAHSSRKKNKKGIQNSTAASIPTLPRKIMPQKVLNKVFFRIVCRPYCWNSFTDVSEEMAPTKQKKKNSLHGFCGDKKLNYHIRNIRKASTPWWVGNDSTV